MYIEFTSRKQHTLVLPLEHFLLQTFVELISVKVNVKSRSSLSNQIAQKNTALFGLPCFCSSILSHQHHHPHFPEGRRALSKDFLVNQKRFVASNCVHCTRMRPSYSVFSKMGFCRLCSIKCLIPEMNEEVSEIAVVTRLS